MKEIVFLTCPRCKKEFRRLHSEKYCSGVCQRATYAERPERVRAYTVKKKNLTVGSRPKPGLAGWNFGPPISNSRKNTTCYKCKAVMLRGGFGRFDGQTTNRKYCPKCVGFIMSRYSRVKVEEITLQEFGWKTYYDRELMVKTYGDSALTGIKLEGET